MKKSRVLLLLLAVSISYCSFSQEIGFVDRIGMDFSFNAVGDEAVIGATLYAEHDQFHWKKGIFYYGAGVFYGTFPNTSKQINRFTKGRTSLFQPLQLHVGHQFVLLKSKLIVRTALITAPSLFEQRITFDDERYNLHETRNYSEFVFTMHAKVGASWRMGKRMHLELFTYLPVVNEPIAPLGVGLGVSRTW